MENRLLRVYQGQVLLQCEFALLASNELDNALSQSSDFNRMKSAEARTETLHRIFFATQNILNCAANVSKVLWGQRGRFAAVRKPLRDSLGITDSSPLQSPDMRNNFEHFDERVDSWWKKPDPKTFVDCNIGPTSQIRSIGSDDLDIFRNIDPQSLMLSFWGEDFDLRAIIDEVKRVLPTLREEARKSH